MSQWEYIDEWNKFNNVIFTENEDSTTPISQSFLDRKKVKMVRLVIEDEFLEIDVPPYDTYNIQIVDISQSSVSFDLSYYCRENTNLKYPTLILNFQLGDRDLRFGFGYYVQRQDYFVEFIKKIQHAFGLEISHHKVDGYIAFLDSQNLRYITKMRKLYLISSLAMITQLLLMYFTQILPNPISLLTFLYFLPLIILLGTISNIITQRDDKEFQNELKSYIEKSHDPSSVQTLAVLENFHG